MRKIILSLFLLFSLQISYAQVTIKMKRRGGVHEIPCKINGLDMSFIFDTGAASVSISLTEALFMLKNGQLTKSDVKDLESFITADGSIVEGTKIILRSIEIAGMTLQNIEASVAHQLNAPLLLGQSAIEKLGKIQLDLANNTLTILNPNFKGSYDYSQSVFERSGGINNRDEPSSSLVTFKLIEKPEDIDFSKMGTMKVYTNSLIYENSEMKSGTVHFAKNNKVDVISRVNAMCYKVKNGSIEGYLWAGWFAY
ncbi:retropepsin-like aspartic protease [Runella sp.]|uniref:retropepsin-like aspartic protease family protein n=1 Tax=Runella sp. TaxID=1960881 RepID=UPI0030159CCC